MLLKQQIDEVLDKYKDASIEYSDTSVLMDLHAITRGIQREEIPDDVISDIIAFELREVSKDEIGSLDISYCPRFSEKNDVGEIIGYPNPEQITITIFEFWKTRAYEDHHPGIAVRYSSLLWEFSKKVTGKSPERIFAILTIDNIVLLARRVREPWGAQIFIKLKYALSLSIQVNDQDRILKAANMLIQYENEIAEDDKPGLWGHSFESLLDNKKISLHNGTIEEIVRNIEERLARLSDSRSSSHNAWAVERAALLLAKYYRKHGAISDVRRVLLVLQESFDFISREASPIQINSWQQNIMRIFTEFNLTQEAKAISIKLQKLGAEMLGDMKKISHSFTIEKSRMEKFVSSLIDEGLPRAYLKIATHFVPQKDDIMKSLDEQYRQNPMVFLFETKIIDHLGRHIGSIGSYDNDKNGHLIREMTQNISISNIFLHNVIKELITRYSLTSTNIVDYLYSSPAYPVAKRSLFELGVQRYIEGLYVESIHILIPQIEDTIRTILVLIGSAVIKPSRSDGFSYKALDEMLRDELFISIFEEDVSLYLRAILTDNRGWNIRNSVCHGLMQSEAFVLEIADRLMHILFLLAQFCEKE